MKYNIFVYGTLMKGMINHEYLSNSKFLGNKEVDGYKMYYLDGRPGVVRDKGIVKGELYEIDENTLRKIDMLEEYGNLYIREEIYINSIKAYIYVYIRNIDNKCVIPREMQPFNNLVYYVSYGSNMLYERFLLYIKGDPFGISEKSRKGCTNKCLPITSKNVIIPYDMYYGEHSKRWNGSVCFLDYSKKGYAYGRAYLITKEQFDEIKRQEGRNYRKEIKLESIDGINAYTFTNENVLEHKSFFTVSESYKNVLIRGLSEMYPHLSIDDINNYLIKD